MQSSFPDDSINIHSMDMELYYQFFTLYENYDIYLLIGVGRMLDSPSFGNNIVGQNESIECQIRKAASLKTAREAYLFHYGDFV